MHRLHPPRRKQDTEMKCEKVQTQAQLPEQGQRKISTLGDLHLYFNKFNMDFLTNDIIYSQFKDHALKLINHFDNGARLPIIHALEEGQNLANRLKEIRETIPLTVLAPWDPSIAAARKMVKEPLVQLVTICQNIIGQINQLEQGSINLRSGHAVPHYTR